MNNWRANGLLLLAAALWGGCNASQQNVLHYVGPLTAVGLRCLLASLVMLPFVWRAKPAVRHLWVSGKELTILTTWFFGLGTFLAQLGFGQTSVINASFFINTWTVMIPFCVWLTLGIKPTLTILPAAGLTLIGTCLMSGGTFSALNNGDLLCLMAAFVFTGWAICLGEFVRKFGNAYFISMAQFVVTGVACSSIGLWLEPINMVALTGALPDLLLLGILSTGVGYMLQAVAQAHTSISVAAVILSLEAVFGAMAGVFMLDEAFTPTTLSGAILILAGAVLAQLGCETESNSARKPVSNSPTVV